MVKDVKILSLTLGNIFGTCVPLRVVFILFNFAKCSKNPTMAKNVIFYLN
jgi:hypothetical protein